MAFFRFFGIINDTTLFYPSDAKGDSTPYICLIS